MRAATLTAYVYAYMRANPQKHKPTRYMACNMTAPLNATADVFNWTNTRWPTCNLIIPINYVHILIAPNKTKTRRPHCRTHTNNVNIVEPGYNNSKTLTPEPRVQPSIPWCAYACGWSLPIASNQCKNSQLGATALTPCCRQYSLAIFTT